MPYQDKNEGEEREECCAQPVSPGLTRGGDDCWTFLKIA